MLRSIKALPILIVGIMMVVSSRETATKYGLMLVLGTITYMYLSLRFGTKTQEPSE